MTLKSSTGSGRVGAVGDIHQVHDHAGALDVLQKLDTQTRAQVRAFDQPRQIGDREGLLMRPLADGDDAEIRLERRKGVVRDLRLGRGEREISVDLPTFG